MKRMIGVIFAFLAALPAFALDGVPAGPLQWYVNPTTGAIVGYRNQTTGHDTATFDSLVFTTPSLTTPTLTTAVAAGTWTASGTWTLPAFTLGGTVSGAGKNLNNIIIGAVTPLAGTFTTVTGNSFIPNSATVPTNGMFLSAANTIGFATNSTERWVINSSGALVPASNATYDIGNGASDPRDINMTRDLISSGGVAKMSGGVGAKNGATVTAAEQGDGVVHKTILTLASTPVTVANTTGSSFGGVKLYDLPEGRIAVLGATANLTMTWTGEDIAADGSGDFSLGTTITADATLDGTDVNLLPSTGMLDPFVLGVGTATGALAASAQFDGTTTPVDANLNIIIDDVDVADGASDVVLVSGTVTITWINLGDY